MCGRGTEKYMLEPARKSSTGKALCRPALVRQVVAKTEAGGIRGAEDRRRRGFWGCGVLRVGMNADPTNFYGRM